MLLRLLLRLPSPGFSRNVTTGDSELDAFLRELDGHLVGSSWIRRPYLLEAADHLLQSRKKHAASGAPSGAAVDRAIEGFGEPARWAHDQRRSRRRIFLATAATASLIGGALLALFLLAIALPNPRLWIAITLPFGVLMGHFYGYLAGPTPSPVATLPIVGEAEPAVEMTHSGVSRFAGVVLLLALLVSGVLTIGGIFSFGPLEGLPLPAALGMLGGILLFLPTALSIFVRVTVTRDGILYRTAFRSIRISWPQVRKVDAQVGSWNALRPPFGRKVRITWHDSTGRARDTVIPLDGGMANVDRFLALLDLRRGGTTGPEGVISGT